jgi:hypothetical protein
VVGAVVAEVVAGIEAGGITARVVAGTAGGTTAAEDSSASRARGVQPTATASGAANTAVAAATDRKKLGASLWCRSWDTPRTVLRVSGDSSIL